MTQRLYLTHVSQWILRTDGVYILYNSSYNCSKLRYVVHCISSYSYKSERSVQCTCRYRSLVRSVQKYELNHLRGITFWISYLWEKYFFLKKKDEKGSVLVQESRQQIPAISHHSARAPSPPSSSSAASTAAEKLSRCLLMPTLPENTW